MRPIEFYGAVGDGITDDTIAIQAAILSGRHLYFENTYLISDTINLVGLSNFSLSGPGKIQCTTTPFSNHIFYINLCHKFTIHGLTLDQNNNTSFFNTRALLFILSSTNFDISSMFFEHLTFIGCCVNSCQQFKIQNNTFDMDVAANTRNYAINVGSNLSTSRKGLISGNIGNKLGSGYTGQDLTIVNNHFSDYKYGNGIATFDDGTGAGCRYLISGNSCLNGSGIDIDNQVIAGMEIDGKYCSVNNNICQGNEGIGIKVFAGKSTISNNTCIGNGTAGITTHYFTPAHNASYTTITGNTCHDNGSNTQSYGYYEESGNLQGIVLSGNNFSGVIASEFIQGGAAFYESQDWINYTPSIMSTVGTLTAGVCTGRYKRVHKGIYWQASCNIVSNGTGSSGIRITLPTEPGTVMGHHYYCSGRANSVSGKMLQGKFVYGHTYADFYNYDETYPGATNETIQASGFYEVG